MKNNTLPKVVLVLLLLVIVWVVLQVAIPMGEKKSLVNIPQLPILNENKNVLPTAAPEMSVMSLTLRSNDPVFKVGKASKVTLSLMAKETRYLDSIEVYVPFDPTMVTISPTLTFGTKMPKPTFSKVSTTRNMVVANFLVNEAKGLGIKSGESVDVLTFTVTPKKEGRLNLNLSTSSSANTSATLLVENSSAKAIPFSVNPLDVVVTK